MKTKIHAFVRTNLCFEASDLGAPRTRETFETELVPKHQSQLIEDTVTSCFQLLEGRFLPDVIGIDLESSGEIVFPDGAQEMIPISLIVSQQRPMTSSIRIGMYELNDDAVAFKSILAHEMGHMLPEWACRKVGVTGPNQEVLEHWSKPNYEAVADWTSAVVTGTTLIGSKNIWFHRDLLTWNSLSESRNTVGAMAQLMSRSLQELGLTKYRAYQEWNQLVQTYLGQLPDPYAEGLWIAKQLWLLSDGRKNAKKAADAIVQVAISGKEYSEPEDFLEAVKRLL